MRRLLSIAVCLLAVSAFAQSPSATGSNVISTMQILRSGTGDYLVSSNKAFVMVMQPDGNLCEYFGSSPSTAKPGAIWCSNTTGSGGRFNVQMHSTNNFCVTTGDDWGQGPALWCTNQVGSGLGPAFARLNDDGNFSIKAGTPAAPGALLWSNGVSIPQVASANGHSVLLPGEVLRQQETLVSPTGAYFVRLEGWGGVLVLYDAKKAFVGFWASGGGTNALGSFRVSLGPTGNLCTRQGDDTGGTNLWCTNKTGQSGPYFAALQNDGNFVVKAGSPAAPGATLWETGPLAAVTFKVVGNGVIPLRFGPCTTTCTESYRIGETVRIMADVPTGSGSQFLKWSGVAARVERHPMIVSSR